MSEAEVRERVCSEVARLLREMRKQRGLSMTELAQRSGLSRAMISFIESEFRNPSLDTLLRVCCALNVELAAIIKRADIAARRPQLRQS
jgi:transcriptional regulator with XRE-family HTH domain